MSVENRWGAEKQLEPVVSDEVVPEFLVQQGFQAGWKPRVRIIGTEGWDSYHFKFYLPRQPGMLPEEVENLFPHRGATGNVRYVRDEARKYLDAILSGQFAQAQRKRTA